MRKKIIIMAMFLLSAVAATAQIYSFNAYVGYTATGFAKTNIWGLAEDDPFYNYEATPLTGFQLGSYSISDNFIMAYDLSYVTGPISKISYDDNYTISNPKDYLRIHFGMMMGWLLNRGHRFQFPIMAGPGFSWISGGETRTIMFDPAVKIRAHFFITRRFGIYAGAGGNAGIGAKGYRIGYTLEIGGIYGFNND